MAFLEWTDTLSVNVASIDAEHKQLIQLVNNLHEAMLSGKGKLLIGETLDGLAKYTVTHFASEEKIQQTNGYPDFKRHKGLHDDLTQQVVDLQQRYERGEPVMTLEISNFLKQWLTVHIMDEDHKIGVYLNAKGMK